MKTTKEMIAVMQAFTEGKRIETFIRGEWKPSLCPAWDCVLYDYRIKPNAQKPKIVPYESAEEFLAAMKEHGPMSKSPHYDEMFVTPSIIENNMCFYHTFDGRDIVDGAFDFGEVVDCKWTWQDGTPCGKEVTE